MGTCHFLQGISPNERSVEPKWPGGVPGPAPGTGRRPLLCLSLGASNDSVYLLSLLPWVSFRFPFRHPPMMLKLFEYGKIWCVIVQPLEIPFTFKLNQLRLGVRFHSLGQWRFGSLCLRADEASSANRDETLRFSKRMQIPRHPVGCMSLNSIFVRGVSQNGVPLPTPPPSIFSSRSN